MEYFVQNHQSPLLILQPLHNLLRLPGPLLRMGNHVVRRDADSRVAGLVLGVRGEPAQHRVVRGGPHLELRAPLLHGHAGVAEDQAAFAHGATGRHTDQCFARSTGQDDDAGSGASVAEHFAETLLLVRSVGGGGLQVEIDVGIVLIVPEIVLGEEREFQFDAAFLEEFNQLLLHFE